MVEIFTKTACRQLRFSNGPASSADGGAFPHGPASPADGCAFEWTSQPCGRFRYSNEPASPVNGCAFLHGPASPADYLAFSYRLASPVDGCTLQTDRPALRIVALFEGTGLPVGWFLFFTWTGQPCIQLRFSYVFVLKVVSW